LIALSPRFRESVPRVDSGDEVTASSMPNRPLVIAHRGASGYLPEHTLLAKALAHAQGADYLEQDVVATRDGELIVCHDVFLDRVTNVAEIYPERAREDGRYYAIDFDWAEIRSLAVTAKPPYGTAEHLETARAIAAAAGPPRICTLGEEIEFIHGLNRKFDRATGIYPEIKQPRWHSDNGFDLAPAILLLLEDYGYDQPAGSIYLQCFDAAELIRIRRNLNCRLPLVQLVGRSVDPAVLTEAGLAAVAEYADVLGPNYRQLLSPRAESRPVLSPIAKLARSAGLGLHPYTFNCEHIPAYATSLVQLLQIALDVIAPEAVFCDYPDLAVQACAGR